MTLAIPNLQPSLSQSRLNQYRLQQELTLQTKKANGRRIFLAQDKKTQTQVVLKIVQLDQAVHMRDQWVELKLFERETQILAALNHPAIPAYQGAFEADFEGVRSFVLVQDYIEATSLETLMQSGKRFLLSEVLTLAERLLKVLSYLHQQTPPVIHRDIKPSNILVVASAQARPNEPLNAADIYLIDFGSVHTDLTKESDTITIVGSYGYIPLEQFVGQALPASDLYSLGMTLIYLMTGVHPADLNLSDLPAVDFRSSAAGDSPLSQFSLPSDLVRWLERMTSPQLANRFTSAEQALTALQNRSQISRCDRLKPEDTKIVLQRDRDRLQIMFDQSGNICSPLVVAVLTFIAFCLLLANTPLSFISALIMSVGLCTWGNVAISRYLPKYCSNYFPMLQRQTVIEASRSQGFRMGRKNKASKRIRWDKLSSPLQDLDLLAYNPGYKFPAFTKGKYTISQRQRRGVQPRLSVHSGGLSYVFGHEQFTPAECWWLGQELSDFLDLELQTIYPMPFVTLTDNTATGGCGC